MKSSTIFPVGGKVEIRDAEWRILSAEMTKAGGQLLKCEGLSQIVRGRVCYFFTLYENDVTLLLPENTKLVADPSSQFIESRLYIETVLRTAPRTENEQNLRCSIKRQWIRFPTSLIRRSRRLTSRAREF